MKKSFCFLLLLVSSVMFSPTVFSQSITITGNIRNNVSQEPAEAVSVLVKGSRSGTYTDERGNFRISISQSLPVTLVISSVGFETKEVEVSGSTDLGTISINP